MKNRNKLEPLVISYHGLKKQLETTNSKFGPYQEEIQAFWSRHSHDFGHIGNTPPFREQLQQILTAPLTEEARKHWEEVQRRYFALIRAGADLQAKMFEMDKVLEEEASALRHELGSQLAALSKAVRDKVRDTVKSFFPNDKPKDLDEAVTKFERDLPLLRDCWAYVEHARFGNPAAEVSHLLAGLSQLDELKRALK